MSEHVTRALIGMFFGAQSAADFDPLRPSTVLQLSGTLVSQEDVVAALNRQSARVLAHPLGDGPQGRQMLLLLRTAANDLLSRFPPMSPAPVTVVPAPAAPAVPAAPAPPAVAERIAAPSSAEADLEEDAVRLIAAHGVVDAHVVRKLTELALSRGLEPEAVGRAIRSLASGVTSRPASSPPTGSRATEAGRNGHATVPARVSEPAREHVRDDPDAANNLVRRFVLVGGGIFVCCVAAVLLALYLTSRGGAAPAPPPPAVAAPGSPAPTPLPAAGLPTAAAPARLKSSEASEPAQAAPDMNQLLRELRRAADEIGEPAAAKAGAERFAGAVATLGRWWPRAEVGQRSAMIEAVVEAVYRSSAQETVRAAVLAALTPSATLARGTAGSVSADGLSRALLGAGVMARLSRERDLPPAVADWLSAEYARLVGPDRPGGLLAFDAGAMHALRLAPLRIVGDGTAEATEAQAALTVWLDAAAALIGSGANAARMLDAAVLDALELLMAEGPSVKASKASYNVIGALAGRLRWRAGDDSRLRLLSWFADPKVSTEALSVVTGAIVTRSSAEGVDLSMVLQAGATGEQRAALRESYALAWQLSAAGGDRGAAQAWLTAARELLGQASASGSSHEALVQAARFARLNEGAVNRKRQQTEAVARAVQQQTYGMILIPINPVTGGPQSPAGDGAWALKFLSGERASAGRRDRIRELEGFGGNIGPVDAEVLAEVAMATLAPEVRVDAQRAAARFSGSPAMVHAALKMLPRAARLQSTVQMIENLSGRPVGPATSDRWQIEARRALVEKLIELLAGQNGAYQSIDRLAAQFAEAYAAMAGREPSPGGYTDDQAGQAARDMAEAYWLVLRSEAGRLAASPRAPVRLDDIDRRREARFAVAGGLLQQFAVEQVGCAELLGYIIAAESPTRATQAADVLASMHEQRRKAGTILDQLLIVERSMTRLWMVRFGESEP